MSSLWGSFSGTITSGIQDTAALLPLLGTEQCEEHVSSALTKGYLYTAAAPMSVFGSLGLVRAGFKALIASISIPKRNIVGAKILRNMGFRAVGENMPLIMYDDNKKQHVVETRLDELLLELHIDDTSEIELSCPRGRWNGMMILSTFFFCLLGMIPYIYLNTKVKNKLHLLVRWLFPVLRVIGGFLTATMTTLIIQARIISLVRAKLAKRNLKRNERVRNNQQDVLNSSEKEPENAEGMDSVKRRWEPNAYSGGVKLSGDVGVAAGNFAKEGLLSKAKRVMKCTPKSAKQPDIEDRQTATPVTSSSLKDQPATADTEKLFTMLYTSLLVLGIFLTVVGYIGCFTVVQNATKVSGPLSWLCLEAGLSIIRIIRWAINPDSDDAPPLELTLTLEGRELPLPTCMKSEEIIWEDKVLPLMRASQFLKMVTSFAGLIERFDLPDLSIYYTLTRGTPSDVDQNRSGVLSRDAHEQALYITVFDHKERTTRIYTKDQDGDHFYSTASDSPLVDLEHGLLEIKIGREIRPDDDPIANNEDIRMKLRAHYQSILDEIRYTLGDDKRTYIIENDWTMLVTETASRRQRQQEGQAAILKEGKRKEMSSETSSARRDIKYLEFGYLEQKWRTLLETRGRWIEDYMGLVNQETRQGYIDDGDEKKLDVLDVSGPSVAEDEGDMEAMGVFEQQARVLSTDDEELLEEMSLSERRWIEMLLVSEVERWEEKFLEHMRPIINQLVNERKSETERVVGEWRGHCWRRLDAGMHAMDARMDAAKQQWRETEQIYIAERWSNTHNEIRKRWQSTMERYMPPPASLSLPPSSPASDFKSCFESVREWVGSSWRKAMGVPSQRVVGVVQERRRQIWWVEMKTRLESEATDVDSRLSQGLSECDKLWSSSELVTLTHSLSKWQHLWREVDVPSEAYLRALKRNKNTVAIYLGGIEADDVAKIVQDKTPLTCVKLGGSRSLPPSIEDNQRLLYVRGYGFDSGSKARAQSVMDRNRLQLATMHKTAIFGEQGSFPYIYSGYLAFQHGWNHRITVSFFGPSSASLILRLVHRSGDDEESSDLHITLEGSELSLPVTTRSIVHIPLNSLPNTTKGLCFRPNHRNDLTITCDDDDDDDEFRLASFVVYHM